MEQTFTERWLTKELRISNIHKTMLTWFSSVTFVVLILVAGLYSVRLNVSRVISATCGSFSSYAEALTSYNDGNTRLDGNGDGIPCNALYGK